MIRQLGFFDIQARTAKLTGMGGPLGGLNERVDGVAFRPDLNSVRKKARTSNAAAKPFAGVLMLKVLVLRQLNSLSDDRVQYPIRDRSSFMRFLGLQLANRVPHAKPVWLLREQLKELKRVEVLFVKFHEQLANRGDVARAGATDRHHVCESTA